MKTYGSLFPLICSFDNLLLACRRAARGKRLHGNVAPVWVFQEQEVLQLQSELLEGTYRPGPYREFTIYDRKPRLISAAPFRDRIVHHALCNVLEPIFERTFIHDSYASRRGKGTHAAIARYRQLGRTSRYVLQADIERYFPTIDHEVLLGSLARKVRCPRTLALCRTIIAAGGGAETPPRYFPGDDLLTPLDRGHGLPIGNQTSQFFANVYLDPLDHFVCEDLRPGGYVRYVDDLLVLGNTKEELWEAAGAIRWFLAQRRLCLPERRCRVMPVAEGVTFLGVRVWPTHTRVARPGVVRYRRRLSSLYDRFLRGEVAAEALRASLSGWVGHAGSGAAAGLLSRLVISRGRPDQ